MPFSNPEKPIKPIGKLDIPGSGNRVKSVCVYKAQLAVRIDFYMKFNQILVENASRNERHFQILENLLFQ